MCDHVQECLCELGQGVCPAGMLYLESCQSKSPLGEIYLLSVQSGGESFLTLSGSILRARNWGEKKALALVRPTVCQTFCHQKLQMSCCTHHGTSVKTKSKHAMSN